MDSNATDAYYAQFASQRDWGRAADMAMRILIRRGTPFSADDFRHLMDETDLQPTTPNAVGGIFQAYSRRGAIRTHSVCSSRAKKRKGGLNRRWISSKA